MCVCLHVRARVCVCVFMPVCVFLVTFSRAHTHTATEYHLGLLKAKLAKYRAQLIEGPKTSGPKVRPKSCHPLWPVLTCVEEVTTKT